MAGLWPSSLLFVPDENGKPIAGARAFFYEADTLTPRDAYQDFGLGVEHTWPVIANGRGIFPAVYLDDGFYRLRVTDAAGNVIPGYDMVTLPVIGPTQGDSGGGETPVDPNALLKTGDVLWVPDSGARDGFVRLNAGSIGNSSSGASERANPDTEALFTKFYNAMTFLPVSGGRGSNAASDFAANKALTLPDGRGRGLFGLSGMGQSASSVLDDVVFDEGDATTVGASGGLGVHTLVEAELPEVDLEATGETAPEATIVADPGTQVRVPGGFLAGFGSTGFSPINDVVSVTVESHAHDIEPFGGGEAHNNMPPFLLGTFYAKL